MEQFLKFEVLLLFCMIFIKSLISLGGDELAEPEKLYINGTFTDIIVKPCIWNITTSTQPIAKITTRCYCYYSPAHNYTLTCTIPGPTLVFYNGSNGYVRLINKLTGASSSTILHQVPLINNLASHDPDVVNLHTHGLHVSPEVDDIIDIFVNPGDSHDYYYNIPSDHYPGTHWYHDHWHGTVAFHVHGGMFGALFVERKNNSGIDPNLANMPQKVLILHSAHLNYDSLSFSTETYGECNCTNYTDWFDAGNPNATQVLSVTFFHLTTICDQFCDMFCPQRTNTSTTLPVQHVFVEHPNGIYNWDNGTSLFLVNNQYMPKITIKKNEWVRLRIVNADAQGSYLLNFNKLSSHCQYYYIASDGIFFEEARDLSKVPFSNYVYSTMAGRIEVILKCNMSGTYNVSHSSAHGDPNIQSTIANTPLYQANFTFFSIVVSSSDDANSSIDPTTLTFPPHTSYLTNTTGLLDYKTTFQCGNFYHADQAKNITWSVFPDPKNDTTCTKYRINTTLSEDKVFLDQYNLKYLDIIGKGFGINNQTFRDSEPLVRLLANQTYEFIIKFGPHPFHHHINPYQLQSNISSGFIGQIGDWRDVVSNGEGEYRVRTRTMDFTGKVIMHCHFLPHEDRGLMGYYMITTNTSTCTNQNGISLTAVADEQCQQVRLSDFCTDLTNDSYRYIISYFWFVFIALSYYLV